MNVEVTAAEPYMTGADLVAVAAGPRAAELGAPAGAIADADPVAIVYRDPAPLAVIALGEDLEGLRTAAAQAVRACRRGGTVAWLLDKSLPFATAEQVRALAEGAVLGGYDGRRWRSGEPPPRVERFVICGCEEELAPAAARAELVARWTNVARELVDAPANVMSPAGLADRVGKFAHLVSEIVDPDSAGLGALAAVGASSPIVAATFLAQFAGEGPWAHVNMLGPRCSTSIAATPSARVRPATACACWSSSPRA